MRNEDLQLISNKILPELYRFSIIIAPDQQLAKQVIIDAMTIFCLENKDDLADEEYDPNDQEQRVLFTKYVQRQLLQEIYQLIVEKSLISSAFVETISPEYQLFSQLVVKEKALMYLREIEEMDLTQIQTLLNLKYHDLVQLYHNAKDKLLNDRQGQGGKLYLEIKRTMNTRHLHLVSSYVYGFCKAQQKDRVEALLVNDDELKKFYQLKQNERDFLRQLIPEINSKRSELKPMRKEVVSIINEMVPSKEQGFLYKCKRVFNRPLVRIEI